VLALTHRSAIPYALPLAAGLALSIPLAVVTAARGFSAALMRLGIGRLPEETAAPVALDALALPALAESARPASATA
jgi:membrane glycosyltransferase